MVTVAKSFEAPIKCESLIYPSSLSPEQKAVGDWLSQYYMVTNILLWNTNKSCSLLLLLRKQAVNEE